MSIAATPDYSILAVCTGNIFRSAAVQLLLADALAGHGVRVDSAGTHGLNSAPMAQPFRDRLTARGLPAQQFRSHRLGADEVARADLVLALTAAHRSAVVRLHPPALRYAVTLKELARAAARAVPDLDSGARQRLEQLAAAAIRARRFADADDDIADPYDLPEAERGPILDEIEAACAAIARFVLA